MKLHSVMLALLLTAFWAIAAGVEDYADKVVPSVDPAKLATLGTRGANPRIQKAVAVLADAEAHKLEADSVCLGTIERLKMNPAVGELNKAALLRNLDIARNLGCRVATH